MGGSTTQPMGASSLMGGANPMGQGAPQGQQEAQQRYDQAGGQGGQGAPQDMSQFADNGMMGQGGQGAPQGGMPQFLQQNSPALGSTNGLMNYGPPQGQGGPPQEIQQRFNQQNSMPAPDMSQLLHGMMGQGNQGQQEAQQRYDMAGGQGAPPMLPPGMMSGAGKGAVNPGAPGNYPLPPGYGSGQGAPQSMNGFKDGGSVDTVIQNALRLLSNRN
ncbi:hypothetical protein UFOVP1301_47 [uncultured Caudovirales phage]|uniref:Uncharacterized protein n=1 Tax=uncultured Caudovirales phage TaxID=2100421 RepID=A0A6J5QA71_9CAUD|nr:hypothetical protein UFOVP663_32 [uncultured Caudovirales phage]CAB4168614.1 hypothetical protein UFOVP894_8 [uncultured Caudovirales phage]CAB4181189.1 hypothetical protein UFOVP1069_20 [uncultured Caudovirales phage]CAB4195981.1 hypothetical protein UFOVP1301_47 [uncultured Caudovirales phage]CAB4211025.1 hypothetical protein UFOVP1415_67 [uncultured Caudovirales phage]